MIRRATVATLKPEKRDFYLELHANPWPEVLEEMARHNHHHHSVFIQGNKLFQYLEYTGDDFEEDMRQMRLNPTMQEWWRLCAECVEPGENGEEAWQVIEEIFRNE